MASMTTAKDLICVISGANRGIGLELTKQLLSQGARIFAGVRSPERAVELRALAERSQGRLEIGALDVTSDSSVKDFASFVQADHVDLLINNAGVLLDYEFSLETIDMKVIEQSFAVNSIGPVRLTQTFLPRLKKSKRPVIANLTSQMGSIADNSSGGAVAYRMSKSALNMFTKTIALDEPSITTLCLHPGWVQTDMGGAGASVPVAKSAQGLLGVILSATRKESGHFLRFDGQEVPW